MNICDSESAIILLSVVVSFIRVITIAVPLLLIIASMIDFFKTVTSNEPDLSKTAKVFFKRLVAAVIVFFVIPIVTFTIELVGPDSKVKECLAKITSGEMNSVETNEEPAIVSNNIIEQNKNECERSNRVYIKRLSALVPIEAKSTEFYLESGRYSYICTNGEVE